MKAIVTGAAGGIGSAMAAALREAGHEVIGHDVRADPAGLVEIHGDLLDPAHREEVLALAREREVDALVLAHGIAAAASLADTTREFSDRAMDINTLSMLDAFDDFRALLSERDGVFVAISSQAGLVGEAANGPYCASKFAVVGWAEGLQDAGVAIPRVRILCPGATQTPLLQRAFEGMAQSQGVSYDDILQMRAARIPAGRLGRVTDLGAAAVWLAELRTPGVMIAPVTGGEVLA
jgi:NAD(P)-dependent dehydrogenase (short-subunit alcohol dehydrogenase family)